jgi:hypothetical protein
VFLFISICKKVIIIHEKNKLEEEVEITEKNVEKSIDDEIKDL